MFLKKVTIKQQGKIYNYNKIVASYRDKDNLSTVWFRTLVSCLKMMPNG